MKKFLVMVRYDWSGKFCLDEWFDFECDARIYIAAQLVKNVGSSYRLLNIVVTDPEPEDITPLANVALSDDGPGIDTDDADAVADHLLPPLDKDDDALASGERRYLERAESTEREAV